MVWAVPFRAAGRRLEARGVLDHVPPRSAWPWLVGAVVALSLPVVALTAARAGERWVITGITIGVTRLSQLTSSQVVNALPDAAVRGSVAAALTLVVPVAVFAVVRRPDRRMT